MSIVRFPDPDATGGTYGAGKGGPAIGYPGACCGGAYVGTFGGAVQRDLVEFFVEDVLREPVHPVSKEGDGERLRPTNVRERPAVLGKRERDERRFERGLHEPRAEHEAVLPVVPLRAHDVRAV